MSAIARIDVYVETANVSGAGTDAYVYIGIGGREFSLDSTGIFANDFEAGAKETFILGEQSNVDKAEYNDPRSPQLSTVLLPYYPVYVRAPNSNWAISKLTITVNPGPAQLVYENSALVASDKPIWLGASYGEVLHLARAAG